VPLYTKLTPGKDFYRLPKKNGNNIGLRLLVWTLDKNTDHQYLQILHLYYAIRLKMRCGLLRYTL